HEDVEAAAETVERTLGPIDVWVNVAFTSVFSEFREISPEEFRRVTEENYLGYVYCAVTALRRVPPRADGKAVRCGSTLSYRGIQVFHESLRCELLHDRSGVKVTMVQMPAVNTPQFDWVLSRLPKPAQRVPPIYQPEVAARAVLHAAAHPRRREYWVGASTALTLAGNAIAPGILDRYLAKTGFDSQQIDRPQPKDHPVNLWEPADGPGGRDFGSHGS